MLRFQLTCSTCRELDCFCLCLFCVAVVKLCLDILVLLLSCFCCGALFIGFGGWGRVWGLGPLGMSRGLCKIYPSQVLFAAG